MNKLILLCVFLAITGCTPSASQLDFSVLPDELKGCKFFIFVMVAALTLQLHDAPIAQLLL